MASVLGKGAPNRRNTELWLLVLAVLLPVLAYADTGLAMNGRIPEGMLDYGLGIGAFALCAHASVRRWAPHADPLMLPVAALLNGLGLVFVWRLDHARQLRPNIPGAQNQLIWTGLGITLFIAVMALLRDHRLLQRYTYLSGLAALVLLAVPAFLPTRASDFGARIWIHVAGYSVQPGEFVKIVLPVFFSGFLMMKRDALALASRRFLGLYLPRGRDLGPIVTVWLLSLLILVFETDLGTSLLFFGVFVVMLYVATERTSWVVFGLLMAGLGFWAVASAERHVADRITAWLHPLAVLPEGGVGQLAQSLFALGAGGVAGTGLGRGHSWLIGFAAKSDFILGTIGEELGLAGLLALFLLYALLSERGLRTALAARDPFGKLLAVGLSAAFALQVFIVAGGVTGTIPLTGMTLPFIAQGGSSVIANWALVALLLKISDVARRPEPAPGAP
ncbi:FtsW/RodA/SpoVE family cell cycle protein [Streptacidiphilus sp. PB12-B1b]|uniref:FtsW/RodA/SpoVE family cell cycle protein n=1 Tax=Streptacidiphilus sp. PB12-B1b TaxID=2705012 RepID=UPI0015F81F26|nr:FtsW/RodA/SpoVE family cell cycle protein [Streptacidiphilus sp. PB12-B1b]QMU79902.1 FtsW/RodA/SpoVE family cell cycle protein [Streptacidiphilus sp. PB12-B1b]